MLETRRIEIDPGIWAKKLSDPARLILVEIASYDCIPNYRHHLATRFNFTMETVSAAIEELKDIINIEKIKNVTCVVFGKKLATREFLDIYFQLYNDKAYQILGRRVNKDGRLIKPIWGGKEIGLLKTDLQEHGFASLKDYMLLFFYDKVPTVREFTREKQKAGYKYTVFHAMIEKLMLSGIDVPNPCPSCGVYWGHKKDCPALVAKKVAKTFKKKEEMQEWEKNQDINIIDMFNRRLG